MVGLSAQYSAIDHTACTILSKSAGSYQRDNRKTKITLPVLVFQENNVYAKILDSGSAGSLE